MARSVRGIRLVIAAGGAFGSAAVALAQDSGSAAGGLPGDALDAYRTSFPSMQVKDFVVDLSGLTSSWGNAYAYGPILKSSRATSTGTVYFNHLIGAAAASNRMGYGPFSRGSYQAWFAPGQGVNTQFNATPTDNGTGAYGTLDTSDLHGFRFGAAMMEFAGGPDAVFGNGDDENNIVAALVTLQARRVNRLYVSRVMALQNRPSAAAGNTATATLGLGAVDEDGHVHLLADGSGLTTPGRLTNKNLVRVSPSLRNEGIVNQIQQSGAAAAADAAATRIVLETPTASATTLSCPSIIPTGAAGRPVMLAGDFASNLVYEPTPGATATTRAHLPSPSGSARGSVAVASQVFGPFAGPGGGPADAGTGAVLTRTDGGTTTRGLSLFTVRADGSVGAQREVQLPTSAAQLTDPTDGFSPGAAFPGLAGHEFTNYQGQVPFRGGNGQVAVTVLAGGDLLAAAAVSATGGGGALPQGENTYLAVARINAQTSAVAWTIAAHTGDASGAAGGRGKAILGDYGADGVPGTADAGEGDGVVDAAPIGRLALRSEVFPGSAGGASISSPAMDRAGNLYFFATAALNSTAGPLADLTVALIRANYSAATGGYQLELLARSGDVIAGANSRRNYRLSLVLNDADSIDSGAVWSGAIVQDSVPGANAAAAPYGGPSALGALVFRARLVYDWNQDGQFIDPSAPGGTGPDQAYNVLMAVMPAYKPGDFDRDGAVTPGDVASFVTRWFADLTGGTGPLGDWNGDGATDPSDIALFVTDWFTSL